ncbi:hypothetical protein Tco_0412118 [Tanacetum coccineum]
MDDELVAPANRLKIGKSNLRLSSNLKSKEPTLQVVLDALKLTLFYKAFEITADVPEIYMQEFWVTISRHHSSLCFKLNGKSHTLNVDNFRDMLKIFPKLPGQIFEEPPYEEEILSFIRDLGHTGEIKFLSDVNVNHMHQPWRSFAAIINKCLSGKTTALESLRLSRAQILWGMYHNKTIDYVYLLREDLVYQVENKNSKKNNDMYYPLFTKVIVYDVILPQHLTNQAMLESEAYKTYLAYATGAYEGTGSKRGVPDVSTYGFDDEQISWKSSDEEDDDEVGLNEDDDEEEELDKEETNDEDKANELYRDVNVNLEGRDIEMKDAQQTNVQTTQVIEDTHVIITPVNPEGQQQSSSVSFSFVSNMLNPNLDTAVSSIPSIVDTYLANKMNEAVKTAVQLQSDRLRDEAQAKNEDFLNKLDDNIKKIIKDQVKEQVKAQTSHVVVANLSELELKKILIDKMESNKSIHRSNEQKNLYKALVDAYENQILKEGLYTYIPDLKRREAYTTYSNPRGFIYQNKDKKNKLMHIDELHKFSDGTLNDVRTPLNDRLKAIQMEYFPHTIWRQSDKDKAGAMIQAIDKQLKTRRIMRSLEKFVGGRPYERDFWLLQRTI